MDDRLSSQSPLLALQRESQRRARQIVDEMSDRAAAEAELVTAPPPPLKDPDHASKP